MQKWGIQVTEAHRKNMISGDLHIDEARFRALFAQCDDVVFRNILLGYNRKGLLVFLDGMVDQLRLETDILTPLQSIDEIQRKDDLLSWLTEKVLPVERISRNVQEDKAAEAILGGEILVLIDGIPGSLLINMTSMKMRSVDEPTSETVIRGPRDGFTESLQINTTLIRRRLKTTRLKTHYFYVGTLSRTQIAVMYVEGIAELKLIDEVMARIQNVQIDVVLDSGNIEELIKDNRHSIFPQMMSTERPDRTVASLAEGKVVILVDNTPFVLIAPTTSFEMLQTAEDYSQHFIIATASRWLRNSLSIMALIFPSLYIAITTMHQEMLPAYLLLSIASSRDTVPFPAIVEALFIELAFEGLREAGVRLPRQIGQAVSIVGALVIGQAAVQAGLVTASLVIVMSATGIASFIFPTYNLGLSIRFLRFPLMIMAGFLGLYGIFYFLDCPAHSYQQIKILRYPVDVSR